MALPMPEEAPVTTAHLASYFRLRSCRRQLRHDTGARVSAAMPAAATLGRQPTRAAGGGAAPRRTEGQRGESRPRARAPRPPRGGAGGVGLVGRGGAHKKLATIGAR